MTGRLLAILIALSLTPARGWAETAPLGFDAHKNTWNATHIVVVDDGKVAESGTGDLKVGAALPDGAARFARIPVPGPDPWPARWGLPAEKLPPISGKRMVLFLAFVPRQFAGSKEPVWMGADSAGHHDDPVRPATVAWVEGDRVYTAVGVDGDGTYALTADGGIAGLKQKVDVGLALRAQFDIARVDPDLKRRAERLDVLTPLVAKYADFSAVGDCAIELVRCGAPAGPVFTRWALEGKGGDEDSGLWGLSRLGDLGMDGMLKVLDREVEYWTAVAGRPRPGRAARDVTAQGASPRSPNRLYHVLYHARAMKLSPANRERLTKHPGLIELDRLVTTPPGLMPESSDMKSAHGILRDILAGKLQERD